MQVPMATTQGRPLLESGTNNSQTLVDSGINSQLHYIKVQTMRMLKCGPARIWKKLLWFQVSR